ncbi:hypothetical protein E2320_022327 [Naja naja]|nr:hypothetical protein E2320_022327 [Naja naja]
MDLINALAPSSLLNYPSYLKARETLLLSGLVFLVLEEDGTLIETEEFFQILEDNTALMSISRSFSLSGDKPRNSKDIARITFDVYKLNPRDLFGSLNISATFYGLYSMSCDFKCLGPKKVLRFQAGQQGAEYEHFKISSEKMPFAGLQNHHPWQYSHDKPPLRGGRSQA